tara:strand:- start:1082 stop:2098 length:1017 start_codon:yes stop_codon:yes gene_type:complete
VNLQHAIEQSLRDAEANRRSLVNDIEDNENESLRNADGPSSDNNNCQLKRYRAVTQDGRTIMIELSRHHKAYRGKSCHHEYVHGEQLTTQEAPFRMCKYCREKQVASTFRWLKKKQACSDADASHEQYERDVHERAEALYQERKQADRDYSLRVLQERMKEIDPHGGQLDISTVRQLLHETFSVGTGEQIIQPPGAHAQNAASTSSVSSLSSSAFSTLQQYSGTATPHDPTNEPPTLSAEVAGPVQPSHSRQASTLTFEPSSVQLSAINQAQQPSYQDYPAVRRDGDTVMVRRMNRTWRALTDEEMEEAVRARELRRDERNDQPLEYWIDHLFGSRRE